MKKKLGTTFVALSAILVFASCDELADYIDDAAVTCPTCPTCPEDDEGDGGTGETETHKDHKISLDTNEYVYVFDLPEEADKDEEVSFKVLTESGYSVSDVSVTYKGIEMVEVEQDPDDPDYDEDADPVYQEVEVDILVELKGSNAAGYSFIMPDNDVTLHAHGLGAYFYLGYNSDYVVHTDYNNVDRKMGSFWHGIYEPVTGTAISSGSAYIQAGRELLIVAERPYTSENIQLYANEEKLEEVTDPEINPNNYFAFAYTMPTEDVEITATADLRYQEVSIDDSNLYDDEGNAIVSAYLYTTEEDKENQAQTVTGQGVSNGVVYVHAEVNGDYAEDYSISGVSVTYHKYQYTYNNVIQEGSASDDWPKPASSYGATFTNVDDNTMKFTIPSAYYSDNDMVISFTLKSMSQYKGYDFVGTWYGYEFYNSNTSGSLINTTIDTSGTFSTTDSGYSASYYSGMYITSVADDNLSCTLSDGRTFYNNGKVGVFAWATSTSNTNDVWVIANGASNVTFDYKTQSTYIWTIRLMSGTDCLGVVCSTGNSLTSLYAGASVTINDGAETLAASSNYTVYDASGNVLISVTPEPAG